MESRVKITVAGKIQDPGFVQSQTCAQYISSTNEDLVSVEVLTFFETQWEEYMKKLKKDQKGLFYDHKASHIIFLNDSEYIGNNDDFSKWALLNYRYLDKTKTLFYKKKAKDNFKRAINDSKNNIYVFIDVKVGEEAPVRVNVELFKSLAPDACENFRKICIGNHTNNKSEKLTLKNTIFHRIVSDAFVQGGDLGTAGVCKQNYCFVNLFLYRG